MSRPQRERGGVRRNALLGWSLLGVTLCSAAYSVTLGNYLWVVFDVVFVAVAALPALATRDWRVLVPWPLLAVGTGALVGQTVGLHLELTSYTAVAAFALVGVTELGAYTPVEMSRRFTIAFAAMTTMAVQGVWTVVQYFADQALGTEYVVNQTGVQWDFVFVTLVAVVVGAAFELYFKRTDAGGSEEEPAVSEP